MTTKQWKLLVAALAALGTIGAFVGAPGYTFVGFVAGLVLGIIAGGNGWLSSLGGLLKSLGQKIENYF